MAMKLKKAEIVDRYNPAKTWLVKRSKCRHYFLSQSIHGTQQYPFKRVGLQHIQEIGVL